MTIILFLVDTSSSMCQKAYVNGVQKSYLDIAKGAVETFLKYRQRSQECMGDRYMLLTFEDPPCNVKAGWKENHATFMNELKNLQSYGLTSMGDALKNAFDLLNLNRMQSGIDTYGQGRCPFYLESSVVIVITDGGRYAYRNGVHTDITLPLHSQIPGTKLTKEPFRWDQRLFSLVLRMSGNKIDEREGKVPHDDSPIEKMCEVTGGRSYRVKSQYVLNQCIESLVQKVQPGVVVQFEQPMAKDLKDGDVQDLSFHIIKKMIYIQKQNPTLKQYPPGFWPIPEPYWADAKTQNLPIREAHPKLRVITPAVEEPSLVRNFPTDKYEVEASPLTLQILSKREANKCWPIIVSNGLHGVEMPFAYLKANPTFTQVFIMILPYNYAVALPLMNDLYHKYLLNPPSEWVYKFQSYIRSIPHYYPPFFRRVFQESKFPQNLISYILPETIDNYLTPAIANYLKTMKNTAKQEQDSLCLRVFKQLKLPKPQYHQTETAKLNCGVPIKRDLVTHPQLRETFGKIHNEINTYENYTIVIPVRSHEGQPKSYRNPYDVPRHELIDVVSKMRESFLRLLTTGVNNFAKDAGHCLPISEMGNYQEYIKNKETPLREIEPTNVRQHMFGNPYKKDKNMVMVDEADLGDVVALMKSLPNMNMINNNNNNNMNPNNNNNHNNNNNNNSNNNMNMLMNNGNIMNMMNNNGMLMGIQGNGNPPIMMQTVQQHQHQQQLLALQQTSNMTIPGQNILPLTLQQQQQQQQQPNVPVLGMPPVVLIGGIPSNITQQQQQLLNGQQIGAPPFSLLTPQIKKMEMSRPRKRKAGPLSKEYVFRRKSSGSSLILNNFCELIFNSSSSSSTSSIISSSRSDFDDGNTSDDTSSIASSMDMDVDRNIVNDFDYNEPTIEDEYRVNGHVQNFINGEEMEESDEFISPYSYGISQTTTAPPAVIQSSTPSAVMVGSVNGSSGLQPSIETPHSPSSNVQPNPTIQPLQQPQQQQQQQPQHQQQQQQQLPILSQPQQNDLNDAQEISKILQQYHNGIEQQKMLDSRDDDKIGIHSNNQMFNNNHINNNNNNNNNNVNTFNNNESALVINNNIINNNNNDENMIENNVNEGNNRNVDNNNISNGSRTGRGGGGGGGGGGAAGAGGGGGNFNDDTINGNNNMDDDELELKENIIKDNNLEARTIIFRDIRKPGRNYASLLEHLNLVKGNLETKFKFVQMCINESLRFRRKKMADSIQEWWDKQID